MRELKFEHLKSNAGIFLFKRKGSQMVVAIIYVDNALFCGPNKAIVYKVKAHFMQKWECRDLGEAHKFLHMHQNGYKISIDQCTYLDTVIQCCGDAWHGISEYYPIIQIPASDWITTIPEPQNHPDIAYAVTALVHHLRINLTKCCISITT